MELLVVIVVIGILSTLALTHELGTREKVLDKEAIVNLKMLRSAQITYRMDTNSYYPAAGSESNIPNINQELKISLRAGATPLSQPWNYTIWSTGCGRATRNVAGGRSWYLTINDADGEPDSGAGCP